jgi:hypothetical protein
VHQPPGGFRVKDGEGVEGHGLGCALSTGSRSPWARTAGSESWVQEIRRRTALPAIHPSPGFTRWGLNNGAARRLTRYGPAVYFPGSSANEVETADDNPITFASGEPYTLALLIR